MSIIMIEMKDSTRGKILSSSHMKVENAKSLEMENVMQKAQNGNTWKVHDTSSLMGNI